ncbi:unnamed protein product [Bemisia tabaci]|uniref:Group XV phospholipase A2 n=1 Tax=Bemisia tabaci TaxID=7038 RepID=A0A9P0AC08_BEMTA|nr:PREDICTED: group XV phospholipase A2-like isoform X2 [Bemisia tabaci]CAH0389323.1 unnamed protein product [Bemisia tabaci]
MLRRLNCCLVLFMFLVGLESCGLLHAQFIPGLDESGEQSSEAPTRTPVIFIPGDGGSQLNAKLNKTSTVHYLCTKQTNDYFNIWLNLELLVPIVIDCLIDNLQLHYDNKTRTTSNSPGVDIQIPGWGNSTVVEWIDPSSASSGAYFSHLAAALLPLGYDRGASLRGAPYDFRKAPNENQDFFTKMKLLVEDTYQQNNNTPVLLVAHSMGGPMSLLFLQDQTQAWKDKYIRAMVTLSGAWGGSIKALKVFAIGDDLGEYFLRSSVLRGVQMTMPSVAWLLPSDLFWKPNEVFIETESRNYTLEDYEDFFNDISYPTGWEMRKDVHKYAQRFAPPGVEVHCLHGYGVNTVEKMIYKKGKWPGGYPTFSFGDGDGTVNKRSLEGCVYWTGKQKQKVYHQVFPKVDHMDILQDKNVVSYIQNLLVKL